MKKQASQLNHIILTSHPDTLPPQPFPIHWGAKDPRERGPIIATLTDRYDRNCIGTHAGAYAIYRALSIASGELDPEHRPDLTDTAPIVEIGPHPSWFDPEKIISLDPLGANVSTYFSDCITQGYNISPSIAITKAHINVPELVDAVKQNRLNVDGNILLENGNCRVTKAAIEPVWYLPGIAKRFHVPEPELRRALFEFTGGMYTDLITRPDLKIFLPPIGGVTVYIFGDVKAITAPERKLAVRVHDECNGSDVFGSDICTCRPYLMQGIEVGVRTAQQGGAGVIVYCRKEGRALGEVTKFLVYNARKRQTGGDRAEAYFQRTECVAGVQDMRFQELMPDVLHWLGITRIDELVSMSNMKYNAIVNSGIEVVERITIPSDLIPEDAQVEIDAKRAAGYYSEEGELDAEELAKPKGRDYE